MTDKIFHAILRVLVIACYMPPAVFIALVGYGVPAGLFYLIYTGQAELTPEWILAVAAACLLAFPTTWLSTDCLRAMLRAWRKVPDL